MTNSADPDQLASEEVDLVLHCLQRQGIYILVQVKMLSANI